MTTIQHSVEVTRQRQVIICRIIGAWNGEVTALLKAAIEQHVAELNGAAWARVMDMQQWTLATPDALALFNQFVLWEDQHGCRLRCFVGLNPIQQQLLDFKYDSTHKPMHFSHMDTAVSYARQMLQMKVLE